VRRRCFRRAVSVDYGPLDEAIIAYQDAVAVFRKTGDGLQRGIALGALGMAMTSQRFSGPAFKSELWANLLKWLGLNIYTPFLACE
jgi:hypothetical protein